METFFNSTLYSCPVALTKVVSSALPPAPAHEWYLICLATGGHIPCSIYPYMVIAHALYADFHPIQDQWYLMADYTIVCFDSTWLPYGILGAVALVLYPIGIPSLYLGLLYQCRDIIKKGEEHPEYAALKHKIGFLFQVSSVGGDA